MRRVLFTAVATLELFAGIALFSLGNQLPAPEQVEDSFNRAERVTKRAGGQVRRLREQVDQLRRPEMQQLAGKLQAQVKTVTALMREQKVDFRAVAGARDALGAASQSTRSLGDALDPSRVAKLGDGLGKTASFLDEKLVPAAESAADRLEESAGLLREEARALAAFLKAAPVDFKTVREVHDSLEAFGKGLTRVSNTLDPKRLETMREGFQGLENALTTGADQVERVSALTYPVVRFEGLRPDVEKRQFWPEGDRIAAGLRKAGVGAGAAGKQMNELTRGLPEIRASLESSRKLVEATRETLATTLKHQDVIEPLLKQMPENAARLAEKLPEVGNDLARVLRDARQLREVAASLRQAQKGIEASVRHWPELRKTVLASADLLKAAQAQLDAAVKHQQDYEKAVNQTASVAEAFASMLPLLTDQMSHKLAEDEKALAELERSIEEAGAPLPEFGRTAGGMAQTGRLLAWLVAAAVLLHSGYLLLGTFLGKSFAG